MGNVVFKDFSMYRIFKSVPVYKEPLPKPEEFGLTDEIISNVIKENERRFHKRFNGSLLIIMCCFAFFSYIENSFLAFSVFFFFPIIRGIFECYIYPDKRDEISELIEEYYKAKNSWWTREKWRNNIEKMQKKEFWTNKKNNISTSSIANLFFANRYKVDEKGGNLLLQKDEKNIVVYFLSSYFNYELEGDMDVFKKKYLKDNDEIWLISLKRISRKTKEICQKNNIRLITVVELIELAKRYCNQ